MSTALRWWPCALLFGSANVTAQALTIYADGLQDGFQDWSWATHALHSTSPVHAGAAAISFEPANWEGLLLVDPNRKIDLAGYAALTLWIHGGSGSGQRLRLSLLDGARSLIDVDVGSRTEGGIAAGTWHRFTLPFDATTGLGSGQFDRLQIMDYTGGRQATVHLDDIVLQPRTSAPSSATVTVNLAAERRAVNPDIYGVNFGSTAQHADLRYPVRRDGGNAATRHHWQFDTHSTASDWFFMNIPDGDGSGLPHNSTSNRFIDATRQYGGQPLITVSTIGWAPRDRSKRWGFSIAKYGPQLGNECIAAAIRTGARPMPATAAAIPRSIPPAIASPIPAAIRPAISATTIRPIRRSRSALHSTPSGSARSPRAPAALCAMYRSTTK